jgi:hypothetical protein
MATKQLPITPEDISSIEEQYKQGPPVALEVMDMKIPGQMSKEEWDKKNAEFIKKVRSEIDDLRLISEYNRLMVEGKELQNREMEAMVMRGQVSVHTLPDCPLKNELMVRVARAGVMSGNQPIHDGKEQMLIKGLVGIELYVTQLQAMGYLIAQKTNAEETIKADIEMQSALKERSLKLVEDTILYTGDNAGQIKAFTMGEDIDAAEPIVLDEGNTERRISFITEDATSRSGQREVSLVPGMYVAKCGDNTFWGLTQEEYQAIKK